MFNLVAVHAINATKNHIAKNPSLIVRTLKNELKVTWERPEKPTKYGTIRSGDIGRYEAPDPGNICVKYQYGTELKDAEPNVRNQFTLGWNEMIHTRLFYEKTLMDSVRSHRYDYKSPAAMIAQMTGTIRYMQHQIENNIAHGRQRNAYKYEIRLLILARMQMVKKLREVDYKQYEWLLERLDMQYKPEPEQEDRIMISRKEGLRQLTDTYCENVRNQKLDEYRRELENQQLPFLEQKLKNLEFIRNEQMALKVDVTISQESIDETRKKYDQMKIEYDSKKVEPSKKKWKVY